jgi:hypothetical protein
MDKNETAELTESVFWRWHVVWIGLGRLRRRRLVVAVVVVNGERRRVLVVIVGLLLQLIHRVEHGLLLNAAAHGHLQVQRGRLQRQALLSIQIRYYKVFL